MISFNDYDATFNKVEDKTAKYSTKPLKKMLQIQFSKVVDNGDTFSFFTVDDHQIKIPYSVFTEKQRSLFRSWAEHELN